MLRGSGSPWVDSPSTHQSLVAKRDWREREVQLGATTPQAQQAGRDTGTDLHGHLLGVWKRMQLKD